MTSLASTVGGASYTAFTEAVLGVYLSDECQLRNGFQQIGRSVQSAVETLLHHDRMVGKIFSELRLVRIFPASILLPCKNGGRELRNSTSV